MKIVLTGSLGSISRPLAVDLAKKGHSVTVISSQADRKNEIEKIGASAAIGSITDAGFLSTVFKDADIVYLMEPPFHFTDPNADTETVWKNIARSYVQAIRQTGVTRAIHLSSIGAHTDKGVGALAMHHHVENILKELPDSVAIKFMRPVGFYGNLLFNIETIKATGKGFIGALLALQHYGLSGLFGGKRGVIMANYGGDVINLLVSPIDIASVISEEMEKPFEGRTVRYIASEERTCSEVAGILGEAIGKPWLKWVAISDKMLANAMLKRGMRETMVRGIVEMGASGRTGKIYEDYFKHRPVLGPTKLKDFAGIFAKAYHGQ